MDDLCRIRLDKKLLNWHIPVPDRVIFQEYFKSLMDVCQKFLDGKPESSSRCYITIFDCND